MTIISLSISALVFSLYKMNKNVRVISEQVKNNTLMYGLLIVSTAILIFVVGHAYTVVNHALFMIWCFFLSLEAISVSIIVSSDKVKDKSENELNELLVYICLKVTASILLFTLLFLILNSTYALTTIG